jgi:hypothetical protein
MARQLVAFGKVALHHFREGGGFIHGRFHNRNGTREQQRYDKGIKHVDE